MARRIPATEVLVDPWMHPVLTLSLLVAWIAASVAIFATLCSSCHPKPSPSQPHSSPPPNGSVSKTEMSAPEAASIEQEEGGGGEKIVELEGSVHGPIYPAALPASASKRKLSASLSGLPEGLHKMAMMKKERQGKGEEDLLWKKTIILGEKCRMPSEEDGDGTQRRPSSCSRLPRSLPASRAGSFAADPAEVAPSS